MQPNKVACDPQVLKWVETAGVPLSYRVEDKMRLCKDKTALAVNPALTLSGIPPAAVTASGRRTRYALRFAS
jgi:hypothetical protein